LKRIFSSTRPSPALVISCIALFASLGGVSYAVATGSIDSREIKDNSVRGKDIRNNAVTESELRRRSLDGTDIKIERVGGDAVKEQVLEVDKLARVPRALNSDTLAGQPPSAFDTRWVLVDAAGQIEAQSGGFTVVSGYVANPPGAAGNVYIAAGEDLTNKGIVSTVALQNAVDQNADTITNGRAPGPDSNPEFSGEISATRCAIPGVVTCAPPNTNNSSTFVVSPRNSDGTVTEAGGRKRFYVAITG